MAWRDQLRPGSFRGAPFLWQDANADLGRATVTHQFPLKEKSFVEDLGKKPETFSLDVLVLGADYMAQRDALLRAFRQPGPGKLVHPTLGDLDAIVVSCRLSESTTEGGIARFALTFAEQGDITFTRTSSTDTQAATVNAGGDAAASAQNAFASQWKTQAKGPLVATGALADLNTTLSNIQAQVGRLTSYDPINGVGVLGQLSTTRGLLTSLLNTPSTIALKIGGLISSLSFLSSSSINGPSTWLAQLGTTRRGFGFNSSSYGGIAPNAFSGIYQTHIALAQTGLPGNSLPVAYTNIFNATPAAVQQQTNQTALQAFVRQTALTEAAQVTAVWPFSTGDQAQAIRDDLAARIDAEMLLTINDDLYKKLAALRFAVVADLTARAASLPATANLTLLVPTPAIVLAHRIYDDPAFDADIVARNHVIHPGFVPAGVPLKVLDVSAG